MRLDVVQWRNGRPDRCLIRLMPRRTRISAFRTVRWPGCRSLCRAWLHERNSVLVSANLAFGARPTICGKAKRTTALRDRLARHCDIVETGNDSWRLKPEPERPPRLKAHGNAGPRRLRKLESCAATGLPTRSPGAALSDADRGYQSTQIGTQ